MVTSLTPLLSLRFSRSCSRTDLKRDGSMYKRKIMGTIRNKEEFQNPMLTYYCIIFVFAFTVAYFLIVFINISLRQSI